MKIKAIRISGFRGIPPIDPPHVDLSFSRGDEPQNVLIFGPNAYGKSSLSSALEWFFRESVHCSHYFEDYTPADNVHVNIGKTGFPSNAYIELDLIDNGVVTTVRKEIGGDGLKTREVMGNLTQQLSFCRDEIITLDHDEFRNFVSAASKDKWTTFASLIGYEELDNFRSGLDSISQKSLTDNLRVSSLEKELSSKEKAYSLTISQTCGKYSIPVNSSLDEIENGFLNQLGIVLLSLQISLPKTIIELDEDYWGKIRFKVIPSDEFRQNIERLEQLKKVLVDINPIPRETITKINQFLEISASLDSKKSHFDKGILHEFYGMGLNIIATNRTPIDLCPLCRSPFPTEILHKNIQGYIGELDFEEIQTQAKKLDSLWNEIKNSLSARFTSLLTYGFSSISPLVNLVANTLRIDAAINLLSYNVETILSWGEGITNLQNELTKISTEIQNEINQINKGIIDNTEGQLGSEIEDLYSFWKIIQGLQVENGKIGLLKKELGITKEVIEKIRGIAKGFREELEDFGGRVIEIINDDVSDYYDALHPNDDIKPFLETQIEGSKRKVLLKCDYKGYVGKDAASLLSESHRNSLGLAVMLAFIKYKRKTGSPVEFLILDDVTQSFDVGHRANLVSFLEDPDFPEICSNQIILLTHDRTLADFIQRSGEERANWFRYDIRTWHLNALVIEPNDMDYLCVAKKYLGDGDEMASAIYARHALEQVYKSIVEGAKLNIQYTTKPWSTKLENFQTAILKEVKRLWDIKIQKGGQNLHRGIINPRNFRDKKLTMSLRILHLTVHESDFLDNPPSIGDIQAALNAIEEFRNMFTCPNCRLNTRNPNYQYFHSLDRGAQASILKCKRCEQPLPIDI